MSSKCWDRASLSPSLALCSCPGEKAMTQQLRGHYQTHEAPCLQRAYNRKGTRSILPPLVPESAAKGRVHQEPIRLNSDSHTPVWPEFLHRDSHTGLCPQSGAADLCTAPRGESGCILSGLPFSRLQRAHVTTATHAGHAR